VPPVWIDLAAAAALVKDGDLVSRALAARQFPSASAVKAMGLASWTRLGRMYEVFSVILSKVGEPALTKTPFHAGLGNYLPGEGKIPLGPVIREVRGTRLAPGSLRGFWGGS
jgi:hypothetical protein